MMIDSRKFRWGLGRALRVGGKLLWEHRYTAGYAMLGYVAGCALDSVLMVSIPLYGVVRLTNGTLCVLLTVAGGICGFVRDLDNNVGRQVVMVQ